MMVKTLTLLALIGIFTACNLDDHLFNPDDEIDEYRFSDFEGQVISELPDDEYTIDPADRTLVEMQSGDYKIYGVYCGDVNDISSDTVILYFHGNRDHMDYYWNRARLIAHAGGKHRYGVFMIDYRGYGLSEGTSTEAGLYEDAETAVNWLEERGLSNDRLVVYGFSLGSVPATEVAANPAGLTPERLILESPIASADAMAQDASLLTIPAAFVTSHEIDNAEKIKSVDQPFLWIHGKDDRFLNIASHGEAVYNNYGGNDGRAARISGAEHSDVPDVIGFEAYLEMIDDFIRGE